MWSFFFFFFFEFVVSFKKKKKLLRKKRKERNSTKKRTIETRAHQRVVGDRQLAPQVPAKGVDVRRPPLLHDDLLLLVVRSSGRPHELAARGAPLLGTIVVVEARGVAGVVSGLRRREVDAHGRVRVVDGGIDGSLWRWKEKKRNYFDLRREK